LAKKKLTEKDFWALNIVRAQQDGKDYIFASVRRKYSDDDIETKGSGEYLGLSRVESFEKITDNDPDSDTFGKRIDKPGASPIGTKQVYTDEFTPANIKKYKAMVGTNHFGQTELIWKFKQVNISVDLVDEFWTLPQDEAYNKYVLKEQTINIVEKENKSNARRRNA